MYKKVSTKLNFKENESNVLEFWKENNIFEKSIESRKDCPTFTFYDGPPTANGKPHIGHVLTRVIKDLIPRYRTMKGYKVLRKAGWDTHGLPVELEVEKLLGLDGKEQIETYGIEPFIEKCKESVWKYKGMWEDFSATVGFWADMDNPYVTYHNDYIESVWWSLKTIWEKDLLYKGHKIVPFCPRCGTPLSSHEVAQGYKDVKEKSVIAKFKLKDKENEYFLAWTTTPWTLPSNVALAVNPNEIYVKVKMEDSFYILAKALCDTVLLKEYKIVEEYKGKDLEKMYYIPLFDYAKVNKDAYYVTCAEYVTLTDGTGIVHIAPAFGEDDSQVGKKYDLPFVQLVNEKGEFVEDATPFKGMFAKNADPEIIKYLDDNNLLFNTLDYEHSYPHCWRCDTPLLYYARESWFIKMTAVRDNLVANNDKINWLPESIGQKRFGDWLKNVIDWGISRNRYWGTPLNIWECGCGHQHAIGSIEELKQMGDNVPETIELHRPFIDNIKLNCPKCSGKMTRVEEVIDCWYDSGSMPFAQWHYPFENKEIFEDNFPADFISEAVDQTRGWFYSLLAISTLLFDKPAYKNCIVLGHVQDADGQKMSKSKGNAVDPLDALDSFGADAIRWYFYSNSAPWLPNRFHDDAVIEGQRKFMGTFWNTYAFYVLYANIDGFDPTKYELEYPKLSQMDKWLLSKLNTLVKYVDNNLENYRITECARALQSFVEDLSNWYVRRSRERFWQKDMPQDKINAYMTLYTALTTLSKVSAPFIPFMADEIYRNLVSNFDKNVPISVHLCDFPVSLEYMIDEELEGNMDLVLKIVIQGRACRNIANIKNRQPIGKMYIKSLNSLPDGFVKIVSEELNIKEIVFTDHIKDFISIVLKPNFKTVGSKYGKSIPAIRDYLNNADGHEIAKKLNDGDIICFETQGLNIELTLEDVLIEATQKPGFVSETDRDLIVILDTNLTPDLIEEGYVRELISKIQTMRKEADFEVQNHIEVYYSQNNQLEKIIERNNETIANEVLANKVELGNSDGYTKEWNINGENLKLTVKRIL